MSFCGKFIKSRLFNKKKTKRRPKIGIWSAFRLKAVKQTIVSALHGATSTLTDSEEIIPGFEPGILLH